VDGPSLEGSPASTANCAPAGRLGGAGPHLISLACIGPSAATADSPAASSTATTRYVNPRAFMVLLLVRERLGRDVVRPSVIPNGRARTCIDGLQSLLTRNCRRTARGADSAGAIVNHTRTVPSSAAATLRTVTEASPTAG